MLKMIFPTIVLLTLALSLCSCKPREVITDSPAGDTMVSLDNLSYPLKKSEDMGQEYIDSFVFLGESTTYHLKSRGVLTDGKAGKYAFRRPLTKVLLLSGTKLCVPFPVQPLNLPCKSPL